MSEDRRVDERCDVCGAWKRAQQIVDREYRYCPMEGFVQHMELAREKAWEMK